jgi:glyoxylase-like metal-dependent hydrolase (beta-lactamase superfamily II)
MRTKIGSYDVGRIAEIQFPAFPAGEFLPAATADIIAEARRQLPDRITDDGKVIMSFHSFVLKTGRYTIMIDTCCGVGKERPGREQFADKNKSDFLGGLAGHGVKPEEVTHVMCTHLHWDHVGWNTRLVNGQWVPTFPNAKYIISKREYDYWDGVYQKEKGSKTNLNVIAFEDSMLPVKDAGKIVLVDDTHEIDKGLVLEPCHGHSPGHVVLNVDSGGQKGVFIGDVIHHPMQVLFPQLSCRADFDMDASRVSRTALIEKHAESGAIILPQHFASPSCGRIKRAGNGFTFDFIAGS